MDKNHCPFIPPADCGEGMFPCPGPMDYMGCASAETCAVNGETCPYYCPYVPQADCGEGYMSCPGPVDSSGCKTMDQCVPYEEGCPLNCPFIPFNLKDIPFFVPASYIGREG